LSGHPDTNDDLHPEQLVYLFDQSPEQPTSTVLMTTASVSVP
jgi:hypothetical protein